MFDVTHITNFFVNPKVIKMALSAKPSKKRKPLRLNTAAAKKRRLAYHKKMRNPAYAAKMRKYRKAYYKKNKAKLLKKARATYKARRTEILKRRKQLRALRAKHGLKGNVSKFFNKVGKTVKKAAAKAKTAVKKAVAKKPAAKKAAAKKPAAKKAKK